MIVKVNEYIDDRGAKIEENELVDLKDGEEAPPRFLGNGMIIMETPMGKVPQEIQVPIEAETIQEAFEKFEDAMREAQPKIVERMKEQIRDKMMEENNKIIVPNFGEQR